MQTDARQAFVRRLALDGIYQFGIDLIFDREQIPPYSGELLSEQALSLCGIVEIDDDLQSIPLSPNSARNQEIRSQFARDFLQWIVRSNLLNGAGRSD